MAHECPVCGLTCRCNGDIDDIDFGENPLCDHCPDEDEVLSDEELEEEPPF